VQQIQPTYERLTAGQGGQLDPEHMYDMRRNSRISAMIDEEYTDLDDPRSSSGQGHTYADINDSNTITRTYADCGERKDDHVYGNLKKEKPVSCENVYSELENPSAVGLEASGEHYEDIGKDDMYDAVPQETYSQRNVGRGARDQRVISVLDDSGLSYEVIHVQTK